MTNYVLKNAQLVNEGTIIHADLRIADGRITKIASEISPAPGEVA